MGKRGAFDVFGDAEPRIPQRFLGFPGVGLAIEFGDDAAGSAVRLLHPQPPTGGCFRRASD